MNDITNENKLPDWARKIINDNESTRRTAFFYRHQAISLRVALHELTKDDPHELAFYDTVCKRASEIFEGLENMRSDDEIIIRNKARDDVMAEVMKMTARKNGFKQKKNRSK